MHISIERHIHQFSIGLEVIRNDIAIMVFISKENCIIAVMIALVIG